MAASAQQLAQNVGYFTAFFRAWGQASAATRDTLYADVQTYEAGAESGATLAQQVTQLLYIPLPTQYR